MHRRMAAAVAHLESRATIHYATAECYLGRLLIAATDKGVCAVSLADKETTLATFLQREFPDATIARDEVRLAPLLAELLRHLSGAAPLPDLPLDLRGTAFQRTVWQEMRKIPYGETRSYSEVAKAIGKPLAARGVACACGANPAVVLIPCHRVIGSDGSLRGNGNGFDMRKKLLDAERERV